VGEGTTFEASCYTDPLALEHLTGSVARAVEHFATRPDAGLRFTTKFDDTKGLESLDHRGRTRARFSLNVPEVSRRFEGGTTPVPGRIAALGRMARAGYPVGLTIAPIMPVDGWEAAYDALLTDIAAELAGVAGLDLTVELITHRFTDTSRDVLQSWYPASKLEMDEELRTTKRGKFGARKHVYPRDEMRALEAGLRAMVAERLPGAPVLYFT
jgi:spore photoproduct lyase